MRSSGILKDIEIVEYRIIKIILKYRIIFKDIEISYGKVT